MIPSLRPTFTARAHFERDQATERDARGNKGRADWQPHLDAAGVPCSWWSEVRDASGEQVEPQSRRVLVDLRMLVPGEMDVTTEDRLERITDRLGNVQIAGPLEITQVIPRGRDRLIILEDQ